MFHVFTVVGLDDEQERTEEEIQTQKPGPSTTALSASRSTANATTVCPLSFITEVSLVTVPSLSRFSKYASVSV